MTQPWAGLNATEEFVEATPTETDAIDDILGKEVPPELPDIILKAADLTKYDVQKVDYSGAQVWKVPTTKNNIRSIISRLHRRNCKDFGITFITCYLKNEQ